MKKYSLVVVILASTLLLTSGCSMIDMPKKPVAETIDVEICDRTGSTLTETMRELKENPENETAIIASLTEAQKEYSVELHKSKNDEIQEMLDLMIFSYSEIINQVQHDHSLTGVAEKLKFSSHKWVTVCTSLSDEM